LARTGRVEVVVDLSVEQVWNSLSDPSKLYKHFGEEITKVTEGPLGLGTNLRISGRFLGRRAAYDLRVVEFETNKKVAIEFMNGFVKGSKDIFILEPFEGNRTKLIHTGELKLGGLAKLFSPILAWRFKSTMSSELSEIKQALEA
jgi:uncharacterized protein YndB with AHSA1/START domain